MSKSYIYLKVSFHYVNTAICSWRESIRLRDSLYCTLIAINCEIHLISVIYFIAIEDTTCILIHNVKKLCEIIGHKFTILKYVTFLYRVTNLL